MWPAQRIGIGMTTKPFRAVRDEDAKRLDLVRARIRRSLDDPRPALSLDEVDRSLTVLSAAARTERGRA